MLASIAPFAVRALLQTRHISTKPVIPDKIEQEQAPTKKRRNRNKLGEKRDSNDANQQLKLEEIEQFDEPEVEHEREEIDKMKRRAAEMMSAEANDAATSQAALELNESTLQTGLNSPGWCTVLHFRSLYRRGFLNPKFVARYKHQEDFIVQMNDPETHAGRDLFQKDSWSDNAFTGNGLLGHPTRGCFWYLFSNLSDLQPAQIMSRLRLGEHYNEGFAILHFPIEQSGACRAPTPEDYSHTVDRIDPQLIPELDVGQYGTLISMDLEAGLVHGIAESITSSEDLTGKNCECFWIRPSLQQKVPVKRGWDGLFPSGLGPKEALRLYLSDVPYVDDENEEGWRWSGTYHDTGLEEGIWRLRYLAQGTQHEEEFYRILGELALDEVPRIAEHAKAALIDFGIRQ